MKDTEFAYAVAYTRTLENKMLGKIDFEALLSAPSPEDALQYLSDKGYGSGHTGQNLNAETLLKEEMASVWHEVNGACPKGAPINIILYQNDFHNLKAILKAVFSGAPYESLMLEPNTVPPDIIHRAISEGKPESLPDMFKYAAAEAYRILARDNDGQRAEIVLDTALFKALRDVAQQSKSEFLFDWVDLNVAIMDMKIALRGVYGGKSRAYLREAMLECRYINADYLADAATQDASAVLQIFTQSGFEEAAKAAQESVSAFEKWCDNKLINYLKSARYKTFGFEPILSFLVGKQFELQAIRIVLAGLRSGIPTETLRTRMRDLYV